MFTAHFNMNIVSSHLLALCLMTVHENDPLNSDFVFLNSLPNIIIFQHFIGFFSVVE